MNKLNKLLIGIIILWSILAIIFGIYDLEISNYLYKFKNSQLFDIGNNYGNKVGFPLFYISLTIIIGSIFNDIKIQRKIGYIVIIYFIFESVYIILRNKKIFSFLNLFFIITFFILTYNKNWNNYLLIAILIILLYIFSKIIVNILKVFYCRIRYKDLNSNSEYSTWYNRNITKKKGKSFPSGHTSESCIFYPFLIYIKNKKISRKIKTLLVFIIISFSLYVGISRIIIGKHYSSDILFSIGICSILTIIFYKILSNNKIFRK